MSGQHKSIKNMRVYNAVRRRGISKTYAAKIANSRGVGKGKKKK